jgi:hypothetical protein
MLGTAESQQGEPEFCDGRELVHEARNTQPAEIRVGCVLRVRTTPGSEISV